MLDLYEHRSCTTYPNGRFEIYCRRSTKYLTCRRASSVEFYGFSFSVLRVLLSSFFTVFPSFSPLNYSLSFLGGGFSPVGHSLRFRVNSSGKLPFVATGHVSWYMRIIGFPISSARCPVNALSHKKAQYALKFELRI